MSVTSEQRKARNYCSNYDNKNCLGVMIKVEKVKDEMGVVRTKLREWIDVDKAGKKCTVEKGCEYFEQVVAPAIR